MLGAHLFGDEAAEHIQFVRPADGDKQVRLRDAGLFKCASIGAVAADRHDVVDICDLFNNRRVGIQRDDVVPLRHKTAKNGFSDFAAAGYNDIHTNRLGIQAARKCGSPVSFLSEMFCLLINIECITFLRNLQDYFMNS